MGVAVERVLGRLDGHVLFGDILVGHVLTEGPRAAVHEQDLVYDTGHRLRREPLARLVRHRVPGPLRGGTRLGVEPISSRAADGGSIVVAAYAGRLAFAEPRHDPIGLGP